MPELYVGLMSGTSVDGIDAVLVDFSASTPRLLCSHEHNWPTDVRQAILDTRDLDDHALDSLEYLDQRCGEVFAAAVTALIDKSDVETDNVNAIGNHGQTIRHRPDADTPFSLQIGNAAVIAELTGIDVVSDFRTADIEAGGQGAPLVPAFHQAVFRSTDTDRVIVNIGGIANITVLPADKEEAVIGCDTGPGNTLMDAWCQRHSHERFDAGGQFAASGKTDAKLLARCLMDEYFQRPAPKSTGFEHFDLGWLDAHIEDEISPEDGQSTLCDLTATSIIRDINRYATNTTEIFICGGGAHNDELMRRLRKMTQADVKTTEVLGIHPDWVEAMCFGWLAKRRIENLPSNVPSVTGASQEIVLGTLNR